VTQKQIRLRTRSARTDRWNCQQATKRDDQLTIGSRTGGKDEVNIQRKGEKQQATLGKFFRAGEMLVKQRLKKKKDIGRKSQKLKKG